MSFEPGQVVTRRYLRGPWVIWAQPMRVISDDGTGLLLWHSVGSDIARLVDADGNIPYDLAVDRMRDPKVTLQSWTDYDILVLMRTGDPLYFDSATAETIRSEGHRLIKLIEAGEFPFDGTHTDFRPDPEWPTLRLTNTLDFPSGRPA
ncbi:hypothetical protein [Rhizomonospora bruguierae]|uniref:hypothetical protein n=1 Tax=Rhizomonospora bruguierae TaxID=1581705 RepID=UPI001BCECAEE|nr:hypothetical protein [Micromonospora sp. NBRC 107566]